jgi:hypothetical protein
MAAISAPTASIFSTLMRPAGARCFGIDASGPRFLFKRQPNGVLDREALRGGKPLGERLGFLRQIDHGGNLTQTAVIAQEFVGYGCTATGKKRGDFADA